MRIEAQHKQFNVLFSKLKFMDLFEKFIININS
jgi:hypothetical protein